MFTNTCDCHFHIFGPYSEFPLAEERAYTPEEASLAEYRGIQDRLGLGRGVVVQPSVYGTDNSRTFDAVERLGGVGSMRAVAVIDDGIADPGLADMHAAGARGARVNALHGGGPALDWIETVSSRIAPMDWHLQVYIGREALIDHSTALGRLPVPLVVDHMGSIDPTRGVDDPAFIALLRLLETGRSWVKLSGYLVSNEPAPYHDVAPYVRKLAEVRPDRLLWGTNWPHPVRTPYPPDDLDLFDALRVWLDDDALLEDVLVRNPERLYGFPAS